MRLLQNLQKLSNKIISGMGHWDVPCIITFKGATYENVRCKYNRHHTSFNELGAPIGAINATIELHVIHLTEQGVPFKNNHGKIDLVGALIEVEDTVAVRRYEVRSVIPDETMGIIVCNVELKNNNVNHSHNCSEEEG